MADAARGAQMVPAGQNGPMAGSSISQLRGLVADIDHFAVHDGPGIRTAVFLKGCSLRCAWCHSPETQSFRPELLYLAQKCTACGLCLAVCPPGALAPAPLDDGSRAGSRAESLADCQVQVDWQKCDHCGACAAVCYSGALKMCGAWMTVDELVAAVEPDRPFFEASGGGVTLSGGEASAQPAFALAFLRACRAAGIHTALETNGCAAWQVLAELSSVVDLFLFDLKHMDSDRHRALTGASNAAALENLRRLAQSGARITARVPCIPGLNDDRENIAATAAFAAEIGLREMHLLPYNSAAGAKYLWLGQDYRLNDLQTQDYQYMDALAELCRAQGLSVQIGG